MKSLNKSFAAAALAAAFAIPVGHAEGMDPNWDYFVRKADANKDGMVTKTEAMKMVEEMFDKADKQKKGMLDKKQVEIFLKMLMSDSLRG